jgi:predicted HicB family RNase H-like nuclease
MSMESRKAPRGRMIHIRLDEETHKKLKIHAAMTSTTIQQLVEDLIRLKVVKPGIKSVKK